MSDETKDILTFSNLQTKRENIIELAEKYGAYNVRVFGSVARGEAQDDSDIDLLVSVQEGVSIFDMVALWLDLKSLLGRDVSLISDEISDDSFMQTILRDAKSL